MGKTIYINEKQAAILESLIRVSANLMERSNKHFKIGKTSQELEKRFDSVYRKDYHRIIMIYSDPDSDFISELERTLIKYYKKYYPVLCNNVNEGENESNEDSFNTVYMVIQ